MAKHDIFNFYLKVPVSVTSFNPAAPDIFIRFTTQGLIFMNEGAGVVEYSFDGSYVAGELDSTLASKTLTFSDRVASVIWFRVKAGSSGPINVSVHAWATR